ncbi:MAG: hypothetical protein DME59_19730 [Verrucomicrobia bacterium]|nr:MAG: hypothetical protein DME59_19730 [Verrucomicrobiota bacterium]
MNTLVTEQITLFIAMIQHPGVPALRIAFTIPILAMSGVGLYTFQKRYQLFDQDPEVDTDTAVARHNRIEEVIFVYARMMLLLRSDTRAL